MKHWMKVAAVGLLMAGCSSGDEPETTKEITSADVAGAYHSTRFLVVRADTDTLNIAASGGSITMTLTGDRKVNGRLAVPLSELGEGFDISFGGTFSLTGNQVAFQHEADTFIRDAKWTYSAGKLSTAATFGSEKIIVDLTR